MTYDHSSERAITHHGWQGGCDEDCPACAQRTEYAYQQGVKDVAKRATSVAHTSVSE